MLTNSQIEQFHRDGFLVLPSVLTNQQVTELRNVLMNLFKSEIKFKGDNKKFRNDICSRYTELQWLIFHPPIVSALKFLLGSNFVFLPEMAAHSSNYSGWHKDTTSQECGGHKFHWQDNYLMVEAALYLQDNNQYGGGLDVVPGSHRYADLYATAAGQKLLRNGKNYKSLQYSIPSKAGDLVLFHFRVDHKATLPTTCSIESIPPAQRKLAMFFACSTNNEHVTNYKQFLLSREDYHYLKTYQYPRDMLNLASEHNLILA
jgi:hypothetical protein